MENKLNILKEQWCKFYCVYKDKEITPECYEDSPSEEKYSYKRDCSGICIDFIPCEHCQVENFIKFIRDDL